MSTIPNNSYFVVPAGYPSSSCDAIWGLIILLVICCLCSLSSMLLRPPPRMLVVNPNRSNFEGSIGSEVRNDPRMKHLYSMY